MRGFKNNLLEFRSKPKNPQIVLHERIAFVVPDRESHITASKAIVKVRIPIVPALKTLDKAFVLGDSLLRTLNPKSIKIVEWEGLSKEEAYQANENTVRKLVEQRDAIAIVVEKVVQPLLQVVADLSIHQQGLYCKLAEQEKRIKELELMMREVYGCAPVIPKLPGGKKTFGGKMYEAADEVLRLYAEDSKLPPGERRWKSETQASDSFFESHVLLNYPLATKENLHWNVAKRKNC